MSSENRNVSGKIDINDKSAERVAFELYRYIREAPVEQQDQELELFSRCIMHVTMPTYGVEPIKKMAKSKS